MNNLLLPFFVTTLFLAIAQSVIIQNCGSKAGSFSKVEVTNCKIDDGAPCVLKRNTNVTIMIEFTPDKECDELTAVVHGDLLGVDVPFPISNPNACQSSGVHCPVENGTTYSYTATLPVLKSYPKVKVNVKWELQDANKDDIVCVLIPAKIE
uniref:Putative major epididymal secretory protein he1 n=1 Tax=Phlebotomus kandelakii TaxID=1109342 RepID=A0A6B2EAJ0_9DIPT